MRSAGTCLDSSTVPTALKPALPSGTGVCVEHVKVVGVDCPLLARGH